MKRTIFLLILSAIFFAGCKQNSIVAIPGGNDSTQLLDTNLILGADMSLLPRYEDFGTNYMDSLGNAIEPLIYFQEEGFNCIRIRLFVNPDTTTDACQTLAYVTKLAKRVKDAGYKFMLDFHYSDTWADPVQQTKPATWDSLSFAALEDTVHSYTKRVLQTLVAAGATPDFIQPGNEITSGMLWPDGKVSYGSNDNWDNFASLLTEATTACREVCPNAKIVIQTERPQNASMIFSYYNKIESNNVDYDIIGLSYYPFWHGAPSVLDATLTSLASNFADKPVMIVEYGYNYNWYPDDATYDLTATYPATPAGQKAITEATIAVLRQHNNVIGFFYWFPEEDEHPYTGILTNWTSRGLFNNATGKALPALYIMKEFRAVK